MYYDPYSILKTLAPEYPYKCGGEREEREREREREREGGREGEREREHEFGHNPIFQ